MQSTHMPWPQVPEFFSSVAWSLQQFPAYIKFRSCPQLERSPDSVKLPTRLKWNRPKRQCPLIQLIQRLTRKAVISASASLIGAGQNADAPFSKSDRSTGKANILLQSLWSTKTWSKRSQRRLKETGRDMLPINHKTRTFLVLFWSEVFAFAPQARSHYRPTVDTRSEQGKKWSTSRFPIQSRFSNYSNQRTDHITFVKNVSIKISFNYHCIRKISHFSFNFKGWQVLLKRSLTLLIIQWQR